MVTTPTGGYADSTPKKAALSSPPTSLSELNFALRSAARQAQNYPQKHKSSSRPPSGLNKSPVCSSSPDTGPRQGRRERTVSRSGSSASMYSPSTRARVDVQISNTPTSHTRVECASPAAEVYNRELVPGEGSGTEVKMPEDAALQCDSSTAAVCDGTRKTIRAASRKSDSSSRPPPKPASPAASNSPNVQENSNVNGAKQRKAASARLSRPELPIHALYNKVYLEEGAPVPQSHPQMFFQKRTRPPSRHRSPQESVGLEVQPQPLPPRMRSAHYPSHHERPPSRCKPPPEALHLEDATSEDEGDRRIDRPSSSRSKRGPTPRPEQVPVEAPQRPVWKRPVSGTPSRSACEGEFGPESIKGAGDKDDSSSEEDNWGTIGTWSSSRSQPQLAASVRPANPSSRKKPSIATVPFRTSLSPDFLRLFAPSGTAAPPTPPQPQMVFNNHHTPKDAELFSDCMTMGLTDIPSPEDDLFADKAFFNKTFEDLCISEDESEQSI